MNIRGMFLSLCSEHVMNIWGFTESNIVVYKTLRLFRPIKDICFDGINMLMSFQTRDSELFFMNEEKKELEILHRNKANEHQGKVNCMDSNIDRHLFITGGEDGFVKIWTSEKEMIREICFPEQINSVCFLNNE